MGPVESSRIWSTVADPDLQIRGAPVIQNPKIVGGGGALKKFFSAPRAPRAPPLVALLSLENYRGRSVFIPKVLRRPFFNNNRHILTLKCEWHNLRKLQLILTIRKPPNILDEWNGYPEIFWLFSSFFLALFAPSKSYLKEKGRRVSAPELWRVMWYIPLIYRFSQG